MCLRIGEGMSVLGPAFMCTNVCVCVRVHSCVYMVCICDCVYLVCGYANMYIRLLAHLCLLGFFAMLAFICVCVCASMLLLFYLCEDRGVLELESEDIFRIVWGHFGWPFLKGSLRVKTWF